MFSCVLVFLFLTIRPPPRSTRTDTPFPCTTLFLSPVGATTFEAAPALAFGAAVRAIRTEEGIAQETLAHLAGIERSHMGKIERGEHMPTLAVILKIARALGRDRKSVV